MNIGQSTEFSAIARAILAGEEVRLSHPIPTRRLRQLKRAVEESDLPASCFLGDPTGTVPCYGSELVTGTSLTVSPLRVGGVGAFAPLPE